MMTSPSDTSHDLARILEREPDVPMNWHRLGVALAEEGKAGELMALCDRAAPRFGSPIRFFHNIAIDLSQRRAWAVFGVLAQGIPQKRLEHPIAVYYQGCEQVAQGQYAEALDFFQAFQKAVLPRHGEYPLAKDANLNTIFRQGTLVEPPKETAYLLTQPLTADPVDISFAVMAQAPDKDYVIAVCVDKRYFLRFAQELCQGYAAFETGEPVHFHVVNPDQGCLDLFDRLVQEHPGLALGLSTEPKGPWDHPVYFTCARFMVMERLLETYGKTIIALDGDNLPAVHLSSFLQGVDDADFASFKTDRTEPASVYQAGVMVFPYREKTRSFAYKLKRYVISKLDTPPLLAWMLDQAALFSVLVMMEHHDPDFRYVNLTHTTAKTLGASLVQLASTQEKNVIMNAPT